MRLTPTPAEVRSLVSLLAGYIAADGAPIKVQQRFYDRYMRKFSALEARYPSVDFRSDLSQSGLIERAKARVRLRVMRGAGATF